MFHLKREERKMFLLNQLELKRIRGLILILGIGTLIISGCGGRHARVEPQVPIQELKAPEWVKKGGGAFSKEKGRYFYGVGSVEGIKNNSLFRTTAENRARNEVAKVFQVYTASLMKDYAASTTSGEMNVTSEEQHVEQAVKTVTAMVLSGVEIMDYWQNPTTGEFFALARLDLVTFKDNLEKSKELSENVRDYIRQNAERLHEQLEKEEEKQLSK